MEPQIGRCHIAALILDEHNLSEMARHGVLKHEVEQVIFNRHITAPNSRGEPGSILLIGETKGGRLLTVPMTPDGDRGTWRPATAFDSSRHQRALFRRGVR